jgi:hypothetical protein
LNERSAAEPIALPFRDTPFDMSRVEGLRAKANDLYEFARTIKNGDERLVVILRALECETEADTIERDDDCQAEQRNEIVDRKQSNRLGRLSRRLLLIGSIQGKRTQP